MRNAVPSVLALILLATAVPARAAGDFDAVYRGESAFLTLARGQTGSFTVFWQNSGSEAWTGQDIVLAACLADKVTCDKQDTTEAPFKSGWVSSTRYAYPLQSTVAPGDIGTFTYSVSVPASTATGTYRFNGTLWHVPTSSAIHNVGYYHDLNVAAVGASTLASISPSNGTDSGKDRVTLTGTGFVCSPMPTVLFGTSPATVTSCGTTTLVVDTPAHAPGDVTVTVTNVGGPVSNGLLFTYEDRTPPSFETLEVVGQSVTLRFSEDVCATAGKLSTKASDNEATVRVNLADAGSTGTGAVAGDALSFGDCSKGTYFTTATTSFDPTKLTIIQGDLVSVAILAPAKVLDRAGNAMDKPQSRATTAQGDRTAPTLASAGVVASNKVLVGFSEKVKCGNAITAGFTAKPTSASAVSSTATDCTGTYVGTTVLVTFPASTFAVGTTGTLTYDPALLDADKQVTDTAGNKAAKGSIALTPYAPAKIVSAKVTTSAGDFGRADAGDVIRLTFDRDMEDTLVNSTSMRVLLSDSDGTNIVVRCGGLAGEGGTADPSDKNIAADCVRDPDGVGTLKTFQLTLREDSVNSGDVTAAGTTAGLQWPGTISDLAGFVPRFSDLSPVDLAGSADKIVEK